MGYLKSKGIVPEAYSPLGSVGSPLLEDELVVEIASKHDLKPADVLLAWLCMSNVHFALIRETGYSRAGILLFELAQTKRDAWPSRNPSPLLVSMPT